MRFHKPTILLLLVTLLMSACATTNFTNSGESTGTKFCQSGDAKLEALVIAIDINCPHFQHNLSTATESGNRPVYLKYWTQLAY
jgi:hypothetical protein